MELPVYYRHFKGNCYKLLHIALDSETQERMVVYQALYGERRVWVRPFDMFFETIERDGKRMRRFEPITDYPSAESIVKHLIATGKTITVMESCTGGLLASMLTDTEGASAIFKGSNVTYSNEEKIAAGVDAQVIASYGVYSAECAEAMALAAGRKHHADIAIGITGTTGNVDPNNADSMMGEVYFCIALGNELHHFHHTTNVSGKSRHEIKSEYADHVFESLASLLGI